MKKSMIVKFVLSIFLTCMECILLMESIIGAVLFDWGSFGGGLGNDMISLFLIIPLVGVIGIFLSSIVWHLKKMISWKEFFIECAYVVAGIGVGVAISTFYLVIRIMILGATF